MRAVSACVVCVCERVRVCVCDWVCVWLRRVLVTVCLVCVCCARASGVRVCSVRACACTLSTLIRMTAHVTKPFHRVAVPPCHLCNCLGACPSLFSLSPFLTRCVCVCACISHVSGGSTSLPSRILCPLSLFCRPRSFQSSPCHYSQTPA